MAVFGAQLDGQAFDVETVVDGSPASFRRTHAGFLTGAVCMARRDGKQLRYTFDG
jgi:hypothetical protein